MTEQSAVVERVYVDLLCAGEGCGVEGDRNRDGDGLALVRGGPDHAASG